MQIGKKIATYKGDRSNLPKTPIWFNFVVAKNSFVMHTIRNFVLATMPNFA
jgi:hypothetical protein